MERFRRKSSDSGIKFLERALSGTTLGLSNSQGVDTLEADVSDDFKGPLGLNLLFDPPEPLVDFIFVHGLGGGSRKTWSKTSHPYHYWPKEWLPRDPDFRNVRIHSFGYNSTWIERKESVLSINDFAQSLLGDLKESPEIKAADTRIVLIGHSMGGLVIKQVCILANQDPAFKDLFTRLHTIYFLATPHRGSDLTRLLANVIKVCYGPKAFVNDLHRNSGIISVLNDGFRHCSKQLQLWSFYEAEKANVVFSDKIVVEKDSAILGYAHERTALLNADHRQLCKFDKPSDSNYRTLRNAFTTTVADITAQVSELRQETERSDLRHLRALLGNVDQPIDDLSSLEDARTAGSCEWLTSKYQFERWRTIQSEAAPILWLSGNPGSGKSVVASHVINHLKGHNLQCSFFFFKHSTPTKSNVGGCLRSLAYQMSLSSPDIRRRLLALEADGISLDDKDDKIVWRKIFLGGIFQTKSTQPHYWVIDALDECIKFQPLLWMISQVGPPMLLRIFITSRKTQHIERGFSDIEKSVEDVEIHSEDTVDDVKLFILSRMDRLPLGASEDRENLVNRVLMKSAGCFLWVRLVLRELEHAWSKEAVEKVLENIPSDMNELYARTLDNMSKDRASVHLAKAILTWTTCAARPLTMNELQCALKLDIGETVYDIEKSINSVCGQLVFVDQESRVQILHQTAQDFLLRMDTSTDFGIRKETGNFRLGMICLGFLCGENFKAPKSGKIKRNARKVSNKEVSFSDYACLHFSDHLSRASSAEAAMMDALYSFLTANVLSWIEYVARTGDLYHLTRTATNIKAYLDRRSKYYPPMGHQLQTVEAWMVDLIRVSAKFRTSLLASPSSIHWLVPPMCPKDSIISRKFSSPHRGLSVRGSQETTWSDCLAQLDYHGSQATAVSCGDRFLAVGLSTGSIVIYSNITCQVYRTLKHGERVKLLSFSQSDKLVASSSLRVVRVFDVNNGCQIHSFETAHQSLDLVFTNESDYLMSASQGNYIMSWGLQEGCENIQIPWQTGHQESSTGLRHQQPPSIAVFSPDQDFIAVCCRGQPILVFSVESENFFGHCIRDPNSRSQGANAHCPVASLVFNPNPEMKLIIVAYQDGELVIYDLWSLQVTQRIPGVNAHTLVCSPDGRTLITGSSFGAMQIFDFAGEDGENLHLIYRINAYEEGIKSLAFRNDNLRFVDIRGSQCRVWEPAILVRKDVHDGSQSETSDPIPIIPTTVGMREGELAAEITAIASYANADIVFCGKQDGSVVVVSTIDAVEQSILYSHAKNIGITCTVWGEQNNILVTADQSGRIIVRKVRKIEEQWTASETLLDQRFVGPVVRILINEANTRILISGRDIMELWDLHGLKIRTESFNPEESRVVTHHLPQPGVFLVFEGDVARLYSWIDYSEITQAPGIKLIRAIKSARATSSSSILCHGRSILVEFTSTTGNRSPSRIEFWQTSSVRADMVSIAAIPGFAVLGPKIEHVIAIVDTRLFFLDRELWVCSIDLGSFAKTQQANRHFFIPPDWRNSSGDYLFQFTAKNDFIFAKRNELLVIKRGLDLSESVSFALA